jgi:hypothetical protein
MNCLRVYIERDIYLKKKGIHIAYDTGARVFGTALPTRLLFLVDE